MRIEHPENPKAIVAWHDACAMMTVQ